MFDISWGEIFVVTGVGLAFIGKRDLPKAANVVGTQVGRIVGFLQGARARADRYAATSELRQLQNELRSGLRELDAVRSELAVSMSPSNMMGRNLGALTANASKIGTTHEIADTGRSIPALASSGMESARLAIAQSSWSATSSLSSSGTAIGYEQPEPQESTADASTFYNEYETSAAVAEAEWAKQGIGYSSSAEAQKHGGSGQLAKLLQQSLIFDRYDRVVAQQDSILQSKVDAIRDKVEGSKVKGRDNSGSEDNISRTKTS